MKGLMAFCAGVMTLCAASSLFVSCEGYDDSEGHAYNERGYFEIISDNKTLYYTLENNTIYNDLEYYTITRNNKNQLPLVNKQFEFKDASTVDKELVINFINSYWPGRWTKEAIDYFIQQNVKLIITVDCGIACFNEVEYAKTLGIAGSMDLPFEDEESK